ncbi:MAG: choice-of-anchor H family protein [Pseudomonadota bacterium]
MKATEKTRDLSKQLAFALAALVLLAAGASLAAEDAEQPRQSVSREMSNADRKAGLEGTVSEDGHRDLQMKGARVQSQRSVSGLKSSTNIDFWIYDADVVLFNDHDVDGHFHGIDLLFDADTYFAVADVYAVLYLSFEGGPWNEYAATENFTILGATSDDEYVVVSELLSGYPTGSYDLLIELYDAFDDSFLASYGPIDTPELAFLTLEDANRDTPIDTTTTTTVVVREGGGSLGWLMLAALLALLPIASRRSPESLASSE